MARTQAHISTMVNLVEFFFASPCLPYKRQYRIWVIRRKLFITEICYWPTRHQGKWRDFQVLWATGKIHCWKSFEVDLAMFTPWPQGEWVAAMPAKNDTVEKVKRYARPWAWDKNIFSKQFLSHENDGSERKRYCKPHARHLRVKLSRQTRTCF